MTRCGRLLVAAGMASVLVLTPALAGTAQSGAWQARSAEARQAVARPWMNAAQSPERRAEELVAQMTLAEKITELHGIQDSQHRRYVPGIPRLGIPPLVITNGPAGVGPGDDPQQQPATALSAPISLAASFDAGLARQYGVITGREARDLGNSLVEGPDVNIARVPENGRSFEGYGEDSYLAGQIGAADIEGIQSQGIIAEVKHYDANNQETNRMTVNEIIADRTLHEIYLSQFEAIIAQARPGAVMCAYPKVNGTYNCENDYLLGTVLRGQWRFGGFVQSDFGAAHSTAASAQAGMDLEMPTGVYYADAMQQAVQDGQVPIATVDELLIRRFTVMIRFGLFDRQLTTSPIPAARDGAFARASAEEGTVLLKNDGSQLPLNAAALHSLAVIGPYAGAAKTGGGGSSHVDPLYTVSPVAGIQVRAGQNVTVSYNNGSDPAAAAALAKTSDAAIVMVGDSETEGADRTTLALSGDQDQLVEAVAAANPHTIVVVKSGGPVLMPWASQVPAIVEAWYPGEEDGNAVAAVLFGDVNPSGKLPVTFPASDGQVPASTPQQWPGVNDTAVYSEGLDVGYRYYDASNLTPLFPFGYGLSYTTFSMSHLAVSRRGGKVVVTADVTNTGTRAGAEVAQVYVADPAAAGEPPEQLRGFARVTLRPGQTKQVTITLGQHAFQVWDSTAQKWTTAAGRYTISLGDSSANLPLHATVTVSS
jgi:beta-glucosidase